jgi:hypothetical protein
VIFTTVFVERVADKIRHIAEVRVWRELIVKKIAGNVTTEDMLVEEIRSRRTTAWRCNRFGDR